MLHLAFLLSWLMADKVSFGTATGPDVYYIVSRRKDMVRSRWSLKYMYSEEGIIAKSRSQITLNRSHAIIPSEAEQTTDPTIFPQPTVSQNGADIKR